MKGLFISVEGPDGSGKTTQIQELEKYFKDKNYDVVVTREPGGTPISEKIREVILDINNKDMDFVTEALLYAAARAQHVSQVIKPAILDGKIVICDRFVDSSIVYQGIGRNLGMKTVENINNIAINGYMPDITFFFKLSPEIGIYRKTKQGSKDRLESEKIAFHKKVFEGYEQLEKMHPQRIIGIDANRSIKEIYNEIIAYIETYLSSMNKTLNC
ncbi:dTMP kinase [Lutibacter sp. B2]|nr:dTMP kinase [Lutibacter sp. B2]